MRGRDECGALSAELSCGGQGFGNGLVPEGPRRPRVEGLVVDVGVRWSWCRHVLPSNL